MVLTQHARQRIQQRSIPRMVVDWVIEFGCSEPAGNGAKKYFFNKPARHRFRRYAGVLFSTLERHLDVYVVVDSEGSVVTVAHRTERINRN